MDCRQSYHLPKLVGSWELLTSALHDLDGISTKYSTQLNKGQTYKSLLEERPMLLLVLDIRKPWPDTSRVPKEILLIDTILIGLL